MQLSRGRQVNRQHQHHHMVTAARTTGRQSRGKLAPRRQQAMGSQQQQAGHGRAPRNLQVLHLLHYLHTIRTPTAFRAACMAGRWVGLRRMADLSGQAMGAHTATVCTVARTEAVCMVQEACMGAAVTAPGCMVATACMEARTEAARMDLQCTTAQVCTV